MLPAQAVVLWRALKINAILRISLLLIGVCCVLPSYAQTPATDTIQKAVDTVKIKADTTAQIQTDTSTRKIDATKVPVARRRAVKPPKTKQKTAPAPDKPVRVTDTPVAITDSSKAPINTPVSTTDSLKVPAEKPVITGDSAQTATDTPIPLSDSASLATADSAQLIKNLQPATDSLGEAITPDSLLTPAEARRRKLSAEPVNENEIGKLEDCEIPFTMAYNIKHMSYKELDSLRIEFQKIILEEEEEKIITIKMRFRDDHIIGYMTQAPIHHSNKYVIINMPINVKIEWCCVPDSTHPNQHCVVNHAEMVNIDTTEHCKRWAQLDDGTDMLEQLAANKKKIDLRKYKKKKKFNPLAIFNVFKRKKKKEMIAIPMDKSLEEILKSGQKSPGSS